MADIGSGKLAVAGTGTTGWFLLKLFFPKAKVIEMQFDKIADAILSGEIDAGVMIHEELLYFRQLPLTCILDLGAEWSQRYSLPLPVGLNVAKRNLGKAILSRLSSYLTKSLQYSFDHREQALQWVSQYGRGEEGGVTTKFVDMFANSDSLSMPADVQEGLKLLMIQLGERGICKEVPPLEIVFPDKIINPIDYMEQKLCA